MPGLANDLNISESGYVTHNGSGVFHGRTFQAGTGITLTNADGIAGNTTISSTASLTDLHTARFIVASSTSGTGANFTTIASAITSAQGTGINSTIFLQPGTYTENFTLPPGINLVAYQCDALTPNVTIVGNITVSAAGTCSISGIRLQTNSAALLTVSGSAATIVNLDNCYLNCTNNTGISFTSSSASAQINITNCMGDLGTTGIALFNSSSAGGLIFENSSFTNTGASVTANTISAGGLATLWTSLSNPLTTSGTAGATISIGSSIHTGTQNVTAFNSGGSASHTTALAIFASGSASAISVSNTLICNLLAVDSTNTNAITGAGTIQYSGIVFTNTGNTINVTTQIASGTLQGSKNTAPSSGYLGEQIRSYLALGSAITLSNAVAQNVTSINLTAGVWDITGIVEYGAAAITGTNFLASLSTVSAGIGTNGDSLVGTPTAPTASAELSLVIPAWRQTFSTTTTVYLVADANFSAGTLKAYGRLSATRVG